MAKRYAYLYIITFLACFFAVSTTLQATHNRAGEITIVRDTTDPSGLTVKATIITYTKESSRPADRDTLTICWGDGFCERVPRSNGPNNNGVSLENDTKRNEYCATHTFPARGTFTISMTDPNRNGGIENVNFPNSEQVKFHIETVYTIPNPAFTGFNNTPVLIQPPIDIGCIGRVFTHNPNAYDIDGDSLSYAFAVPLQDVDSPVPNYQFPDQINPGADNRLTIDPVTGDIVWDAPQREGEYNLAMYIIEWRNGFPIDTMLRDMQILIQRCDNQPPEVVTSVDEICVVAGETVSINVTATAPITDDDEVRLTALGGPFEVAVSPATFLPDNNIFLPDPVNKVFTWRTTCEHISDQFYTVVFRAVDNFFGDTSGLATLKTVRIKVVGPPPEDVLADATSEQVEVSWELPYICEDTQGEYFRGFTVWRREGSLSLPIDTCDPGLTGKGYEKLNNIQTTENADGRYIFIDQNVERGRTYCYRVQAEFARVTPFDPPVAYNLVEGLASDEVCVQLSRDVPLITNVNVLTTDPANGEMEVCWSKPKAEDLDTLLNPGPYVYEVLRATGITLDDADFQPIGVEFVSEFFANANDTCFIDTGLNTEGTPYSYKINFYVDDEATPLGATNSASSVYLSTAPTDEAVQLSWDEEVPWNNFEYDVFRFDPGTNEFELVAADVTEMFYTDTGLENGVEYCYKVQSEGSYGVDGVLNPILNFSQETCEVPEDNVPPCPPELTVNNICDELGNSADCPEESILVNTLNWTVCPEADDVAGFNIYFTPTPGGELTLIERIDNPDVFTFDHSPEGGITGCYAVSAFDFNNNESSVSEEACAPICDFIYRLPNAFTPNGDGQNDIYRPISFCFVDDVDFQVFNRWGQLVYETSDPALNWDGKNLRGELLSDGVYYYVAKVFVQNNNSIPQQATTLSGYIELLGGNNR